MNDKLIKIAVYNTALNKVLETDFPPFNIYRSKGLLTHLLNRKHFLAAKYIDHLSDIISNPDYAGYTGGNIELVKTYKENIMISIKLDVKKNKRYVATMFEAKTAKIEAYVKSGRLKKVNRNDLNCS